MTHNALNYNVIRGCLGGFLDDELHGFCLNCSIHAQKIGPIMIAGNNLVQKTVLNPLSTESEVERLRRDIYRPDIEKLKLFAQMLRANSLYKKAKVIHK